MNSFEGENMQTQYNVLSYRIEFYFHGYKLAIEIDENGRSDRNVDYEIKRQRAVKQEFGCKFFRNDTSNKENEIIRIRV